MQMQNPLFKKVFVVRLVDLATFAGVVFGQLMAMSAAEILEQLKQVPAEQRLEIVETVLNELRAEMERDPCTHAEDAESRPRSAAQALLPDYTNDKELTAFTALDGEAIHA